MAKATIAGVATGRRTPVYAIPVLERTRSKQRYWIFRRRKRMNERAARWSNSEAANATTNATAGQG
eukprot:2409835-Pyramimonas_sp.AAC.1